jgi:hypothetical protein
VLPKALIEQHKIAACTTISMLTLTYDPTEISNTIILSKTLSHNELDKIEHAKTISGDTSIRSFSNAFDISPLLTVSGSIIDKHNYSSSSSEEQVTIHWIGRLLLKMAMV